MKRVIFTMLIIGSLSVLLGCPIPADTEITDYKVGDTGPAGGMIFYNDIIGYDLDENGTIDSDEKDLLDGINDGIVTAKLYLEAAPSGWYGGTEDPLAEWGLSGTNTDIILSSYDYFQIGSGEPNTAEIISLLLTGSETGRAAQLCYDYSGGGYSDWFLPSHGEVLLIEYNRNIIPGLSNTAYSTSTEKDIDECYARYFSNDGILTSKSKNEELYIRPIRSF